MNSGCSPSLCETLCFSLFFSSCIWSVSHTLSSCDKTQLQSDCKFLICPSLCILTDGTGMRSTKPGFGVINLINRGTVSHEGWLSLGSSFLEGSLIALYHQRCWGWPVWSEGSYWHYRVPGVAIPSTGFLRTEIFCFQMRIRNTITMSLV